MVEDSIFYVLLAARLTDSGGGGGAENVRYNIEKIVDQETGRISFRLKQMIGSRVSYVGDVVQFSSSDISYNDTNVYAMITDLITEVDNISKACVSGTTSYWNSQVDLISVKDRIYQYTDYQLVDGIYVPGIKLGDGTSYLIDLPFIDLAAQNHMANQSIHVSESDRTAWDNNVSVKIDTFDNENLILY